jgi:hypothetical protein
LAGRFRLGLLPGAPLLWLAIDAGGLCAAAPYAPALDWPRLNPAGPDADEIAELIEWARLWEPQAPAALAVAVIELPGQQVVELRCAPMSAEWWGVFAAGVGRSRVAISGAECEAAIAATRRAHPTPPTLPRRALRRRLAAAGSAKHQRMRQLPAPNLQPSSARAQLAVRIDAGILRLQPLEEFPRGALRFGLEPGACQESCVKGRLQR